ncbi:MAG TPA: cobalamin B12-binding domain-containing protein [Mycobacteriales bacterium]|nr:cobalamin B12-binding domain-containing protein [Mycobacteriales bacterium]
MLAVHERLPELLGHLERAALVDAARLVGDLAAGGVPVPRLVDDLLVPAQVEVGRRWASARWSVAQEHAATAIIETVLTTASLRAPHVPPAQGAPSVVLVCAEGEWHALAAKMAAESLRGSGVDVTFLGPSLPSEVLAGFVRDLAPTALGVSCSLGFALPGALRCVEAAHEAGVPALAAGRAFGADGARAAALGADAWVAGVPDAVTVLEGWAAGAPQPAAPRLPADDEWRRLADETALDGDALRELLRRRPGLESFSPALVQRLRKDLQYALRYGGAAQLVGDDGVLVEHAAWLADVLAARSVPREVVTDLLASCAHVLAGPYPATSALFARAAAALPGRPA